MLPTGSRASRTKARLEATRVGSNALAPRWPSSSPQVSSSSTVPRRAGGVAGRSRASSSSAASPALASAPSTVVPSDSIQPLRTRGWTPRQGGTTSKCAENSNGSVAAAPSRRATRLPVSGPLPSSHTCQLSARSSLATIAAIAPSWREGESIRARRIKVSTRRSTLGSCTVLALLGLDERRCADQKLTFARPPARWEDLLAPGHLSAERSGEAASVPPGHAVTEVGPTVLQYKGQPERQRADSSAGRLGERPLWQPGRSCSERRLRSAAPGRILLGAAQDKPALPPWRNRYTRQVEGLCPKGRGGSSPLGGTRSCWLTPAAPLSFWGE